MLVVTSNWCLSDGTLSAGPPRRLIDRFRAEVRRSSLRHGFRRDGSYRPVDAIDVVLAGDTFDWLVSREWTGDVRPWDEGRKVAAALERVAVGSLRRGGRLLATLAAWMRRGIEVPAADRRGRPMQATLRRVPVRVAMLRGDRDRWLEQVTSGGALWSQGPVVGTCWSDGDVTVRHGEELDPLYGARGRGPTLGESLAVDLIARFGRAIDDITSLQPAAAGLLRWLAGGDLIDVPTRLVAWLTAHDRGGRLPAEARQELVDAWRRAVECWHRAARRLPPRGKHGVDLVGRLAEWLELGGGSAAGKVWQQSDFPSSPANEHPSEDACTVVLGHLAADIGATTAWRRQVICLGPRGLPARGGLEDDFTAPAVVVIRPGCEGRQVDWLPMASVMRGAGEHNDEHEERGVWLSDVSWAGRRIVDAA